MSFGILIKLLLVSCNFKLETPPDFERKGVSVIHLNELVSQFLRVRTLSNLLLAWGHARDGGVAVTVGVMSGVLVGVLAIAIDLGRAGERISVRTDVQLGVEVISATQIDHSPGSCVGAMQAGDQCQPSEQGDFREQSLAGRPLYRSDFERLKQLEHPSHETDARYGNLRNNQGRVRCTRKTKILSTR